MEKSVQRDKNGSTVRTDFCSEALREKIEKRCQKECLEFSNIMQEIAERISQILPTNKGENLLVEEAENLRCALQYLYISMPLSDRVTYPFETYLDYAKRGVKLRKNRADVQALSEAIFFPYVLFHRVNEEEILPCRTLFGEEIESWLKEGKKDFASSSKVKLASEDTLKNTSDNSQKDTLKNTPELVKEINYWCSQEGTYRSTDNRTLSALMFYQRGYGRCGEESVFAVNAMRSMGVPCRQIYAPRWAHCEDNHAWIEVFVEGKWQFLGACEPMEKLNIGWFNAAASRAILIHSRYFGEDLFERCRESESLGMSFGALEREGDFSENQQMTAENSLPKEELLGKEGIVTEFNQISRYAESKKITILVLDSKERPVPNVSISLELLNTGEYYPIARPRSNEKGELCFHCGFGTLLLEIYHKKECASQLIDTRHGEHFTVRLSGEYRDEEWRVLDFFAPKDSEKNPNTETEEEKARGKKRLSLCKESLKEKKGGYQNQAILSFLQNHDRERREEFLSLLTEKDLSDVSIEVLEDSYLDETSENAYLEEFVKDTFPEEIIRKDFQKNCVFPFIMNPRVDEEVLRPYKKIVINSFHDTEKEQFLRNPKEIWNWIQKEIKSHPDKERWSIITPPSACLSGRVGSALSKAILFVAIARSLGIPARLRKSDKAMEYWEKTQKNFIPVLEEERESCKIVFRKNTQDSLQYGQHWTLAREISGEFKSLNLREMIFQEDSLELSAVPGRYRIITENRFPNGNIQGADFIFTLKKGEKKEVEVLYRKAELKDMLEQLTLSDFTLYKEEGGKEQLFSIVHKEMSKNSQSAKKGTKAIFFWLEPGAEPTEHILNEILEQKERFSAISERMYFVMREKKGEKDPLFNLVRQSLPSFNLYFDRENRDELLARRMYVEPGSYPFILLAEEDAEKVYGIYAVSGYQVGTGDMLLRIMEE